MIGLYTQMVNSSAARARRAAYEADAARERFARSIRSSVSAEDAPRREQRVAKASVPVPVAPCCAA